MSLSSILGPVMTVAGAATGQPWLAAAGTAYSAHQQNKQAQAAAQRQMDYQTEMSNTSYQRQVADLKAAGINPMLVSKLGGASTPAGAMPQFVNPGFQAGQTFSGMQSSAASAQQAETSERLSQSQVKQIDATVEKIIEETRNVPVEGERLKKAVELLVAQTVNTVQSTATGWQVELQTREMIKKLKADTTLLDNQIAAEAALDDLGRKFKQLQPAIDLIKPFIRR